MEENKNMKFYEELRNAPKEALKTIQAGRLKGMSDVNPMWRIKVMTKAFGVCGFGWKYEITNQWTEAYGDEVKVFTNINLYIKVDGEWSEPIPGTGGSSVVAAERSGFYVSDECVDGDCEVLTKNGWVKFKDYNGTDEIAQFNDANLGISFVKPERFIKKASSDVYDRAGVLMTANHRQIMYSKNKKGSVVKLAHELAKLTYRPSNNGYGRSGNYRDYKFGFFGEPKELSLLQKVGIMIACDGTLYRTNSDGEVFWRCEFAKERKIKYAEELLKALGITYKKTVVDNEKRKTTAFVFSLNNKVDYKTYKNFIPYGNYPTLWNEIVFWDGSSSKPESFCTTRKDNAEYLHTILTLSGMSIKVYKIEREEEGHSDCYVLYKKLHGTASPGCRKVEGTYDMYCVTVPTSFFLIRKNMDILVTGNCYKMALTDALSVAMKALGVAADVYFGADVKYDTKYSQDEYVAQAKNDTKKVENKVEKKVEYDDNLKKLISECTSSEAVGAIWNAYPYLRTNQEFKSQIISKGSELKAQEGAA